MLKLLLILSILGGEFLYIYGDVRQSKMTDDVCYLQASNTKNLFVERNPITLKYNSIDGVNGFNYFQNGTFMAKRSGVYFTMLAAQVGSTCQTGRGEVHIWAANDKDMPYSNNIQSFEHGRTSVLVYPSVFRSSVNPLTTFKMSTVAENQCPTLGLIATTFKDEPLVPSVILSVIQLGDADDSTPYAALISDKTQLGRSSSQTVTLSESSELNRMDITSIKQDGMITYTEDGIYFLIVAAQIGSEMRKESSGDVRLWLHLNGQNIPNSNTIQTVRNGSTGVLISQTIVEIKKGDKVQLKFSSTDKDLGLIASPSSNNEPVTPSMVFSTFRLHSKDEHIPYTQLSSSNTLMGDKTPMIVKFNNDDGSELFENMDGRIIFKQAGTYFVMAAAQVGSENNQGMGNIRLWMRLNGKDMDNSNTVQTVNLDTSVLVCQTTVVVQANDYLQMVFNTDASNGKLGFIASHYDGEPTVPSIIFSAFKSSYMGDH